MKNFNQKEYLKKLKIIAQKEMLSFQETLVYINTSASSLYKLTSKKAIPFSKPNGGKLYFKKSELDEWMLQNKSMSTRVFLDKTIKHLKENGNKRY